MRMFFGKGTRPANFLLRLAVLTWPGGPPWQFLERPPLSLSATWDPLRGCTAHTHSTHSGLPLPWPGLGPRARRCRVSPVPWLQSGKARVRRMPGFLGHVRQSESVHGALLRPEMRAQSAGKRVALLQGW